MQRHTRDKLRARERADFDNYCTALRNAQGKEAFEDILDFLSERNAAASIALKSKKLDLISLHLLNVPSTLNVTYLNTNSIENSFRN